MRWCLLIGGSLFLMACQSYSPATKETLTDMYTGLAQAGKITAEEYTDLIDALDYNWSDVGVVIGEMLGTVLVTLGIVKSWRGGINNRKGEIK